MRWLLLERTAHVNSEILEIRTEVLSPEATFITGVSVTAGIKCVSRFLATWLGISALNLGDMLGKLVAENGEIPVLDNENGIKGALIAVILAMTGEGSRAVSGDCGGLSRGRLL